MGYTLLMRAASLQESERRCNIWVELKKLHGEGRSLKNDQARSLLGKSRHNSVYSHADKFTQGHTFCSILFPISRDVQSCQLFRTQTCSSAKHRLSLFLQKLPLIAMEAVEGGARFGQFPNGRASPNLTRGVPAG